MKRLDACIEQPNDTNRTMLTAARSHNHLTYKLARNRKRSATATGRGPPHHGTPLRVEHAARHGSIANRGREWFIGNNEKLPARNVSEAWRCSDFTRTTIIRRM